MGRRQRFWLQFARPLLEDGGDGQWRNMAPHDAEMLAGRLGGAWAWIVEAFRLGTAQACGWVEIDGSWWRITPAGRAALLPSTAVTGGDDAG